METHQNRLTAGADDVAKRNRKQKTVANRRVRHDVRRLAVETLENRWVLSANALPIEVSTPVDGELATIGEVDCYSFNAVQGNRYNINTSAGSLQDAELRLLDPSGFVIFDSGSEVSWIAHASDTFFVEIVSPDILTGTYSISVDIQVDDHGDSPANATPLPLSTPTSGRIDFLDDQDVFAFGAIAGTLYDFTVIADDFFPGVEILAENGDKLADLVFPSPPTWIAPDDGTFFLSVEEGTFKDVVYTVEVAVSDTVDDHGDELSSATRINVPSTTAGAFEAGGDIDTFVIQAEQGRTYNFIVDRVLLTQFVLRNAAGVELFRTSDSLSPFSWVATQTADLYLSLENEFLLDDFSMYSVTVETTDDDHGNSISAATALTPPYTATGRINFVEDHDVFAFDVTAGEIYNFAPSSTFSPSFDDVYFRIVDANENEIFAFSRNRHWLALETATVFLDVVGYQPRNANGDDVEFTVGIREVPYFDDHGNSARNATPLGAPARDSGRIDVEGDVDFFAFEAREGTRYNIELDGQHRVRLLAQDGTTMITDSSNGLISWQSPSSNTFYLEVSERRGSDYRIQVAAVGDQHSNASSGAEIIELPYTTRARIDYRLDVDFFSFHVIAGAVYESFTIPDLDERIYVQVFDSNGTHLSLNPSCPTCTRANFTWIAPHDGIYSFLVGGQVGTYTAGVHEITYTDDFSNLLANAKTIQLPATIEGQMETERDSDFFSFDAIADTVYDFRTESVFGSGDQIRLYDNDGPIDFFSGPWVAPASGTYYLEVNNRNGGTGEYTLTAAPRIDDHGNFYTDATAVTLPANIVGKTDYTYDGDAFSFEATSGTTYTFDTTGTDLTLLLYNSDGDIVQRELTSWTAPQTGSYSVVVSRQLLGEYSLQIGELDRVDDHRNTSNNATPISLSSTTNGAIGEVGDIDVFSFSAIENANYIIDFRAQSLTFWHLKLLDDNGQLLESEAGSRTSPFPWTAPATATYILEVSGLENSLGLFTLNVDPDVDFHADTIADATAINGAPVEGRQYFHGDTDFFSFSATAGTFYQISIPHRNGALLDVDGVTRLTAPESGGGWLAPSDGTYFIEVNGRTDPYVYTVSVDALPVADDHGSLASNATHVTAPSVHAGKIDINGDVDYFAFEATAGTQYNLFASRREFAYHSVTLFSEAGQVVMPASGRISWTAPSDGSYFIQVAGRESLYALEIETFGDDHGDSPIDATAVSIPAAIDGRLDFAGDEDFFSFDATAGTIYDISSSTSSLALTDSAGTIILGGHFQRHTSWRAPENATYFLWLRDTSGINTEYVVDISFNTIADDHGNARNTATELVPSETVSGTLGISVDADWFAFPARASQFFDFSFTPGTLRYGEVRLFDTAQLDAFPFFIDFATGTTEPIAVTWMAPDSGTYYLEVSGVDRDGDISIFNTGNYELLMSTSGDDHGNAVSDATLVTLPAAENGKLEFEEDNDFFAFTVDAGVVYEFGVTIGELTLYDVDGAALPDYESVNDPFAWSAPVSGTYYLEVSMAHSIGDYVLFVRSTDYVDDHGNLALTATSVSVPSTTDGDLEIGADVDFFTFTVTAGTTYRVSTSSSIDVELRNPNGERIEIPPTFGFTATDDGEATIRVSSPTGDTTPIYDVEIDFVEDDHGNTRSSATVLSDLASPVILPIHVIAEMNYVGDVDVFAFRPEEGKRYRFIHDGDAANTTIRLVNQRDFAPVTFGFDARTNPYWWASSSDVFLLEVEQNAPSQLPGPYSFRIVEDPDVDSNDTPLQAPSITTRDIDFETDQDNFIFHLTGQSTYSLRITSDTLESGTVTLVDNRSGNSITTRTFHRGESEDIFVPVSRRQFRVIVRGLDDSVGTYTLSITDQRLPCDYVGADGCDINDLNALYAGTNGAATPLTPALIEDWLNSASDPANSLKQESFDTYLLGDINLDGDVNSGDCGYLLNNFGQQKTGWDNGDLNGDGIVNSTDLGMLLNNFGYASEETTAIRSRKFESVNDDDENDDKNDVIDIVFAEV